MKKTNFGTKEIVAVVMSIVIYGIVTYVQKAYFGEKDMIAAYQILTCIKIMFATLVMAMFGPMVATISALGCITAEGVVLTGQVDIITLFAFLIYGLVVGKYSDKFRILEGEFRGIRLLDYNVVVIVGNVITLEFVTPLLRFLMLQEPLFDTININSNLTKWNSIISGLGGCVILYIVSMVSRKFKKQF